MTTDDSPEQSAPDLPAQRSRLPVWAGDSAAIVVVAIAAAALGGPLPPHHPHAVHLSLLVPVAIIVAAALIPLRRLWPVPVLAAALMLYSATAVVGAKTLAIGIVAILAAYSVGLRTTRLMTFIAGGAATAVVAVLSVTVSTFGTIDPQVFQIAAALAVAAALGDSSRSHREYVRAATERADRAERTREAEAQQRVAEERLRIAQDLHDTVAHQISVISLSAGVASSSLESSPDKAREALGTIRASARGALTEIGDLLRYLRHDTESGAAAPPQPGLGDLDALIARVAGAGLEVSTVREGDLSRVVGVTDRVAYRVVQEGLTNAHKHGSDGTSTVRIAVADDAVTVTVTNPLSADGRNQSEPPGDGLGLTGIRERVASARGTVSASADGGRFTLTARLPLRQEDRP